MPIRNLVSIPVLTLPLLIACASERVVTQPEIVEIIKVEKVHVPANLLIQHNKTTIQAGEVTYGEALEYWSLDRAIIDTLNGQIRGIESLNEQSPD